MFLLHSVLSADYQPATQTESSGYLYMCKTTTVAGTAGRQLKKKTSELASLAKSASTRTSSPTRLFLTLSAVHRRRCGNRFDFLLAALGPHALKASTLAFVNWSTRCRDWTKCVSWSYPSNINGAKSPILFPSWSTCFLVVSKTRDERDSRNIIVISVFKKTSIYRQRTLSLQCIMCNVQRRYKNWSFQTNAGNFTTNQFRTKIYLSKFGDPLATATVGRKQIFHLQPRKLYLASLREIKRYWMLGFRIKKTIQNRATYLLHLQCFLL